jgi:hypothetical protein
VHVIAVKGNIQLTVGYLLSRYPAQQFGYTVRQPYTTGLYAYDNSIFKLKVVLNQLMSEAVKRNV